ncbi:type II secretion system protein GspG [Seongchinamella sediminis]|uniref:type II secretion system protein GspG n=1 Tax=Seongchinamella sediminis TaxID=2283635 RepID=UPI0013C36D79|nr:type II secretion system protein GspG [Seongchinamella sediminis]
MFRLATLCFSALTLAACSSDIDQATQLLTDSIRIKSDLEVNDVTRYPGGVVCGQYSAYLSYSEPRQEHAPFIVKDGELDRAPGALDWQLLCTDDPVTALVEETGIGPFTESNRELIKVNRDMTLLTAALENYHADNSSYPLESDGLQALLSKPQNDAFARNYREGGYLDELPLDPWGRPYRYQHTRWGRVKGHFELSTLGKSGTAGGEGPDADISSTHLPYLQRIARLLGVD